MTTKQKRQKETELQSYLEIVVDNASLRRRIQGWANYLGCSEANLGAAIESSARQIEILKHDNKDLRAQVNNLLASEEMLKQAIRDAADKILILTGEIP